MEKVYRYEESLWTSDQVFLTLLEFTVLRHTPCGFWIDLHGVRKRFINKYAKKQYACETKEEALKSFRARKLRQISILKAKLQIAERALVAEPDVVPIVKLFLGGK